MFPAKTVSFLLFIIIFFAGIVQAHAGDEMISCCIDAAVEFNVPADILLAIAEIEGGRPGTLSRNKNGTVDIGPMQFNSVYLRDLEKHGVTPEMVNAEGCYPYRLAAWRIRQHLDNDNGDIFKKAANYHSKTPSKNDIYRIKLIARTNKWASWLSTKTDIEAVLWNTGD